MSATTVPWASGWSGPRVTIPAAESLTVRYGWTPSSAYPLAVTLRPGTFVDPVMTLVRL